MRRIVVVGILGLLLCAAPALAGVGKGNGEIGFDFGATDFGSEGNDRSGGRFVFRGGYHFNDRFELEGYSGASIAADVDPFDTDVTLTATLVNGVFNFRPSNDAIVPYVLAGVGIARLDLEPAFAALAVDDTGAAYLLAGGSRFFFGEQGRVAVRVELSFLNQNTFDNSSTSSNLVAGFTWRLGAAQ